MVSNRGLNESLGFFKELGNDIGLQHQRVYKILSL